MTNLNLNQIFINCSSQTMCGIKPANLFTISTQAFEEDSFRQWETAAKAQGLSISQIIKKYKKVISKAA